MAAWFRSQSATTSARRTGGLELVTRAKAREYVILVGIMSVTLAITAVAKGLSPFVWIISQAICVIAPALLIGVEQLSERFRRRPAGDR